MRKRIVLRKPFGIVSALWSDGKVEQLDVDRLPQEESLMGTIHVGKVRNIVKNIKAAFVEVAGGQMCYYSLEKNPLPVFCKAANGRQVCQDDEIVVQITRAGVKGKEPTAESVLSLNGRYIVLIRGKKGISFSRKIADSSWREQVCAALAPYLGEEAGVIVRTNAHDVPVKTVEEEMVHLYGLYRTILETAAFRTGKSLLYAPDPDYLRTLRDTDQEGLDEIITDDGELYEQIASYWTQYAGESKTVLRHYQDSVLSLGQAYGVDSAIGEALSQRVWLKSGAYLVIQPTEALTAVDVNSGRAVAGKTSEKHPLDETFYKINLEAARETMRQLRLRNLSGIIIIDFINMRDEEKKRSLLEELSRMAWADPVTTVVVDMTKLNLVEITRKKIKQPLHEWMANSI